MRWRKTRRPAPPYLVLLIAFVTVCIARVDARCGSRCYGRAYLCLPRSPTASAAHQRLERTIREELKQRFSVCAREFQQSNRYFRMSLAHPGNLDAAFRRPTIAVSVVECEGPNDWRETRLREWPPMMSHGCRTEISLLLVLVKRAITPVLFGDLSFVLPVLNDDGTLQLGRNYTVDAIEDLFRELFGGHEIMNRNVHSTSAESFAAAANSGGGGEPAPTDWRELEPLEKGHWPLWAIVVLVVCVFLSIVAFLIGNCINKRNSPRPLKAGKIPPGMKREGRRNWGAGFSGGMWAAA